MKSSMATTPCLRTLLFLGLICVLCPLSTAPAVTASPLYLARQRAGQNFIYEARRNANVAYDAMLENASYNYPYAFTEDMNMMIRDLFTHATLYTFAYNVSRSFDRCVIPTGTDTSLKSVASSGCYKTLLHAGIAGDCVATNPLCCVLYWRYPANLSDRLDASQIDPQLVFWDGSKAVNGFFTNFSVGYLATYSDCAALPTVPAGNSVADGVALAMDSTGEWRFTRRVQPMLSFVEHHVSSPTGPQATQFAVLSAAGASVWGHQGQFGNLTIVAPIVVCAGLLLVCVALLLITYCCTEPQAKREVQEMQALIEALEKSTEEQEAEICRRRTRSEPRSRSASSQSPQPGSFTRGPKVSQSPVDFRRSPSNAGMYAQPSQMNMTPQRQNSARLPASPSLEEQQRQQYYNAMQTFSPQSGRATPTALLRRGSQSQKATTPPVQPAMSSGRRANITPDHRRPVKKVEESPQQQQLAVSGRGSFSTKTPVRQLSRNGSFTGNASMRQPSRNSSFGGASSTSPSTASRRPSQNFQNPLVGRQTFK